MAKIKSIKSIGLHDVYNMEVDKHHNYSVCGGLIIHNCMDRNRYATLTDSIVYQNRKVFSGKGSTEPQEQTPVHRVGTHSRI